MIQRDESAGAFPATRTLEFLVRAEVTDRGPSPEVVATKLADALIWVEGCLPTTVELLVEQRVGDNVV